MVPSEPSDESVPLVRPSDRATFIAAESPVAAFRAMSTPST